MPYSQNNEEEAIIEALTGVPPGRFLDIGAYDGKAFSNTMRLTELGWGGLCFEPSPSVFLSLLNLHGANEKLILINAAVSPSGGLLEFWDSCGDAISTTNQAHMEKWKIGWKCNFKKFFIQSISMENIWTRWGLAFEFINIDVEGESYELFQRLPLNILTHTKVICVEHDGHTQEIASKTRDFGFDVVLHNGENIILAR